MLTNIYVIYDQKAKVYNRPFYLLNDDVAHRVALDMRQDSSTDLARHPEDFIMFRLGTYDDQFATLNLHDDPVTMFRFHELQLPLPISNVQC